MKSVLVASIVLAGVAASGLSAADSQPVAGPNVVLILADDKYE